MTMFAHPEAAEPAPGSHDPDAPALNRPPRWALGNWPVRRKVLAIALVPMALAALFGALRISGALADAARLQLAADRAEVVPAITNYMAALDNVLVAASSDGDTQGANKNYESRKDDIESQLAGADVAGDVRSGVATLLERGQGLVDRVLSNSIGLREEVTSYAPILLTAEEAIDASVRVDDEQVRAEAEGLSRAVGARGQMTMQGLLVNRGGELPEPELRTSMTTVAGTEPSTLFGMSEVLGVDSSEAKKLQQQMVTRMAIMADPDVVLPNNPALQDSIQATDEIASQVINDTVRSVTDSVQSQAADRHNAAIRDIVLVLGAVVVALLVVWSVARSLVRPLHTLRDGALRVAHTELERGIARVRSGDEREPAPLPVHTSEEVGQVAHAVDELHAQALLLAGDEARLHLLVNDMFETMSRRNRSLVDQQLLLIDRLERNEEDPDRLDSLFRLDHLAARMRRNGANLLVLADARASHEQGRSMSLSAVIDAATSEVEDYRRVETAVPDVTVTAAAGGDAIHLFAELIDNALRYSSPTTPVRVSAATADVPRTREVPPAGVVIEIADEGLGMTDADLRIANMRLGGGGEVTPENARHMGLFVVSRLAHRHEIRVWLSAGSAAGPGVTAEVHLPPSLLLADTGAAEPPPRRIPTVAAPPMPEQWAEEHQAAAEIVPRNGSHAEELAPSLLPRRSRGSSGMAGPPAPDAAPPEPAETDALALEADDPLGEADLIYQGMLSDWLVDPHELARSPDLDWKSVWDHGWSTAAEAEKMPVASHTDQGLPVREPGARLVPGSSGVASSSESAAANHRDDLKRPVASNGTSQRPAAERDPDAVRTSISNHFGGVRAGRSHAREQGFENGHGENWQGRDDE
jgi:signal transduction histidine kinase